MSFQDCHKSPRAPISGSRLSRAAAHSASQRAEESAISKTRTKCGRSEMTVSQILSVRQSKYPCVSRFRMPITCPHGIPSMDALPSGDILLAASPIISSSFTRDSKSIRFLDHIVKGFAFGEANGFPRCVQHVVQTHEIILVHIAQPPKPALCRGNTC